MNEPTAVEKGLARPNKDNHEWREGYHVVYPDGYESWSPQSVFNEAYKPADTPYERMIIESCELAKKIEKLSAFMESEDFLNFDKFTSALMYLQNGLMTEYLEILTIRLSAIENGVFKTRTKGNISFSTALRLLSIGFIVRRRGWENKNLVVTKQIPAEITSEVIPNMQSLPSFAKELIMKGKGSIKYTAQCLIYDRETCRADSWSPTVADIFSNDWEIILPEPSCGG